MVWIIWESWRRGKKNTIEIHAIETRCAQLLDDAERVRFAENCKGWRYRCLIGGPESLLQLFGELKTPQVGQLLMQLGKEDELGLFVTLRYTHMWAIFVYAEKGRESATLYKAVGHHAEEAYVLLRIKGAAGDIISFFEDRTYLPVGDVKNGDIALNILSLTKSLTLVYDEQHKVKGVSAILIDSGSETQFIQILNDLTTAPNKLRGLGIGKTKRHPYKCPSMVGEEKEHSATMYVKQLAIPRMLVKTESRLAQVRAPLTHDTALETVKGRTSNSEQKTIHRNWQEQPADEQEVKDKHAEQFI